MANYESRLRRLEQDHAAGADLDGGVVWLGDGPPPASGLRHIQDIRWVDDGPACPVISTTHYTYHADGTVTTHTVHHAQQDGAQ